MSMLCKTEWSLELRTWSHKMNLIDILQWHYVYEQHHVAYSFPGEIFIPTSALHNTMCLISSFHFPSKPIAWSSLLLKMFKFFLRTSSEDWFSYKHFVFWPPCSKINLWYFVDILEKRSVLDNAVTLAHFSRYNLMDIRDLHIWLPCWEEHTNQADSFFKYGRILLCS